jgi:hypothetical protein
MSIDSLKTALGRRPFEPFKVILSSGDAFEVRHPEFAWLIKGGLYVGLPSDGVLGSSGDLPERAVFCLLLHIAAVEQAASA